MVHRADLTRSLRAALEGDPAPRPGPDDRLAAVLAPLILEPEPALLFTVRAAALSRHAGEVSFPGGLQDPGESLLETALREANEEIGLDPSEPDVVGALPPIHTFVSGILVVPFVGVLGSLPALTVNRSEIDEVLTEPIARLLEVESAVSYDRPGGGTWHGFAYELDRATIWGATGWMLHRLLDVIAEEAAWPIPERP